LFSPNGKDTSTASAMRAVGTVDELKTPSIQAFVALGRLTKRIRHPVPAAAVSPAGEGRSPPSG